MKLHLGFEMGRPHSLSDRPQRTRNVPGGEWGRLVDYQMDNSKLKGTPYFVKRTRNVDVI